MYRSTFMQMKTIALIEQDLNQGIILALNDVKLDTCQIIVSFKSKHVGNSLNRDGFMPKYMMDALCKDSGYSF
jgi:hypothetical protein